MIQAVSGWKFSGAGSRGGFFWGPWSLQTNHPFRPLSSTAAIALPDAGRRDTKRPFRILLSTVSSKGIILASWFLPVSRLPAQ